MTTKHLGTIEKLRARSKEAGRFVLPLDRVWADKLTAAQSAVNQAEVTAEPGDPESSKRVADAQAELDALVKGAGDEVVIFKFRRLGRAAYDALVTRNPPTAEQRKEDEDKLPRERRIWNPDTFGPQLVNLTMFDPKLSFDEIVDLINGPPIPEPPKEGEEEKELEPAMLSKAESEQLLNVAILATLAQPRTLPSEVDLP